MDQIEIRIHEEINDYHEKFYWFTFRQWLAVILFGITAIPFYFNFRSSLGEDPISYIIIIYSIPFALIGFVPIQKMPAEKMIKYVFRKETLFFKTIPFKTEKEIFLEKEYMNNLKFSVKLRKALFKKYALKVQNDCDQYVRENTSKESIEINKVSDKKRSKPTRKERKKIKQQKKLEKFKTKALKKGWISDDNISDQQIEKLIADYLKKKEADVNEKK